MSRDPNKQFDYGEVYLNSPNTDTDIDLTPSWVQLEVVENIYSPFISGNITIADAGGFQEIIPLIGEETLFIKLSTGDFRDFTSRSTVPLQNREIKGRFRIYKVSEPVKTNNERSKLYTLYFVSHTFFRNKKARVQKSYTNKKISEIVKNIYNEFIKEESIIPLPTDAYEKNINVQDTLSNYTFCIPNKTPYDAISMIKKKALSAPEPATPSNPNPNLNQGATYLFFETMDTFEFVSLERLLNETPQQELTYKPKSTKQGERETLEEKLNQVEQYNVVKTFDVLENLEEGMYSSKLITYDMLKQTFSEVEYNYLPRRLEQTSLNMNNRQAGLTSTTPVNATRPNSEKSDVELEDLASHIAPGKLCTEHNDLLFNPKQRVYLKPTKFGHDVDFAKNTKVAGGPKQRGIQPDQIELSFLQRKSQLQQLNNIKIGVLLRGNSERHPGQMVNFKLPSDRVQTGRTPDEHLFYSGKFLITQARHVFVNRSGESGSYTTHLELSKDSLNTKLPGVEEEELDPNNLQSTEQENAISTQKALLNLTTTGKVIKGPR